MSSEIEFIPFEVADVVLKDGSTVRVRPAKKDDALYLINFFIICQLKLNTKDLWVLLCLILKFLFLRKMD